MLEMKENREILNEELERLYGRGAKLLCESAGAGRTETRAGPSASGPEPSIVERIVELFDGEILGPGPEENDR